MNNSKGNIDIKIPSDKYRKNHNGLFGSDKPKRNVCEYCGRIIKTFKIVEGSLVPSCGCTRRSCEGCSVMEDLNNTGTVPTVQDILTALPCRQKGHAESILNE